MVGLEDSTHPTRLLNHEVDAVKLESRFPRFLRRCQFPFGSVHLRPVLAQAQRRQPAVVVAGSNADNGLREIGGGEPKSIGSHRFHLSLPEHEPKRRGWLHVQKLTFWTERLLVSPGSEVVAKRPANREGSSPRQGRLTMRIQILDLDGSLALQEELLTLSKPAIFPARNWGPRI